VGVIVGVLLFSLGLRLTLFRHSATGLLWLSLWFRDVVVAFLLASALYLVNLGLICVFGGAELRERVKLTWKEVIKSRLEGKKPQYSLKDMIDHAAFLKIRVRKCAFRMRGFINEP
jgi:hypothetical protein